MDVTSSDGTQIQVGEDVTLPSNWPATMPTYEVAAHQASWRPGDLSTLNAIWTTDNPPTSRQQRTATPWRKAGYAMVVGSDGGLFGGGLRRQWLQRQRCRGSRGRRHDGPDERCQDQVLTCLSTSACGGAWCSLGASHRAATARRLDRPAPTAATTRVRTRGPSGYVTPPASSRRRSCSSASWARSSTSGHVPELNRLPGQIPVWWPIGGASAGFEPLAWPGPRSARLVCHRPIPEDFMIATRRRITATVVSVALVVGGPLLAGCGNVRRVGDRERRRRGDRWRRRHRRRNPDGHEQRRHAGPDRRRRGHPDNWPSAVPTYDGER